MLLVLWNQCLNLIAILQILDLVKIPVWFTLLFLNPATLVLALVNLVFGQVH